MEERTILVYLPSSYEGSENLYPVIYVTDGDAHIHHMSGLLSFLQGNQLMPDSILVAIPHSDRNGDLLPRANRSGYASGHADTFLAFLEHELIPYMNEHYRTHPYKALAGHSYGGLFVNYTMITNADLFNGYIAADPSLWWDGQRLGTDSLNYFANLSSFEKSYYFDQSEISNQGGVEFENMLISSAPEDFRWKFVRMREETHGTIVHKSYYNGLEFIFENWPHTQVVIHPEGGLFTASEPIEVMMSHPLDASIRYTTDGSNPTENSAVYSVPIYISENSTVRASVFLSNNRISIPVEASYTEAVLFLSVTEPVGLIQGLIYERYEGSWEVLPDFLNEFPVETGNISNIMINQWYNQDNFAIRFLGYMDIPSEGIYSFALASDDGSKLIIDGTELITNDGLHADVEEIGYALLAAGLHQVEVQFFERGGESLTLRYKEPDQTTFRSIPSSIWYH